MYFGGMNGSQTLDEIIPGLFLGSYAEARNKKLMQEYGITHILNVAQGLDNCYPDEFTYRHVPMQDMDDQNLLQFLDGNNAYYFLSFIDSAIGQNGKVFVHCAAGISRSSSTVIAYLMWKSGLRFKEAMEITRRKHQQTSPNRGFVRQLLEYECTLVGSRQRPLEYGERYVCQCGAYLFSSRDVQPHESPASSQCRKFFIDRPEWLDFWDLYESRSALKCFKCYKQVGEQARDGLLCSCGVNVRPAFVVDEGK